MISGGTRLMHPSRGEGLGVYECVSLFITLFIQGRGGGECTTGTEAT